MSEWDQILREDWYSKTEPDEIVVAFATMLAKKSKLRVLDLGCGAGRHQVYMAERGFEAYGVDISDTGLRITKERLRSRKYEAFLAKCDMKMLPYVDSCFDAVISLHTIYHQRLEEMRETISEIRRILRKNGFLLMNFLSTRTCSHGKGIEVEENTFVENQGVERGVLHHFADRKEVKLLLESFGVVRLDLSEKAVEGKLRSRWLVTARKQMKVMRKVNK